MTSIRDHGFHLHSPGQTVSWTEQVVLMFCTSLKIVRCDKDDHLGVIMSSVWSYSVMVTGSKPTSLWSLLYILQVFNGVVSPMFACFWGPPLSLSLSPGLSRSSTAGDTNTHTHTHLRMSTVSDTTTLWGYLPCWIFFVISSVFW